MMTYDDICAECVVRNGPTWRMWILQMAESFVDKKQKQKALHRTGRINRLIQADKKNDWTQETKLRSKEAKEKGGHKTLKEHESDDELFDTADQQVEKCEVWNTGERYFPRQISLYCW